MLTLREKSSERFLAKNGTGRRLYKQRNHRKRFADGFGVSYAVSGIHMADGLNMEVDGRAEREAALRMLDRQERGRGKRTSHHLLKLRRTVENDREHSVSAPRVPRPTTGSKLSQRQPLLKHLCPLSLQQRPVVLTFNDTDDSSWLAGMQRSSLPRKKC